MKFLKFLEIHPSQSETDLENDIFSKKPLNWVFGKTLKYRIKKLNTWPGQLEHALLTFRTPLAPT